MNSGWNFSQKMQIWLHEECALTGNLNLAFLRLRIANFSYIDFPYYRCISATFRKRIEQPLHQSLEPALSVPENAR